MKNRNILILALLIVPISFIWQNHLQPYLATFTESAVSLLPPEARYRVPEFSLYDLNSDVIHLRDYRGSVVLMGYWATW